MNRKFFLALIAFIGLHLPILGLASEWPTKTIELICPYSAGGGSDTMARQVANALNDTGLLGKGNLIVTNKTGGNGLIGAAYVANKKNDQYTLSTNVTGDLGAWVNNTSAGITPDNFKPVAMFCWDSYVLVVSSDSPYSNMENLIKASQEKPGSITLAGTGLGTVDNILYRQMVEHYGLKSEYVSYNGGGEVVSGILGGHITASWCNPSEAISQIKAGKMKALAVAGDARIEKADDIPTTAELGFDKVKFRQYRGVFAPKNMPDENIKKLADALKIAVSSTAFKKNYLDRYSLVGDFKGPEGFRGVVNETWEELKGVLAK